MCDKRMQVDQRFGVGLNFLDGVTAGWGRGMMHLPGPRADEIDLSNGGTSTRTLLCNLKSSQ